MGLELIIPIAVLALFVIILLASSYVKTSPSIAYVISGWPMRKPKFLIGTGGIKIPGLQKVDKLYLGQLSVDIKACKIPTKDFINVNVDAVAKVRINPADIAQASANFLNMTPSQIAAEIQDSLEGNMREIVGTQELKALNIDRDGFSNQIQDKAAEDMKKLGIEILTCNIQSITDEEHLIEALGADNTCKITKDAQINKANADRDVAKAKAAAEKEANDARVEAQTQIAEKNTELAIRQAELKTQADVEKAKADAAYQIQEQEQLKEINVKTVDAEAARKIRMNERQKEINARQVEAEVEKAKQEQLLREQEIAIKEKTLQAEVNKQAEAEKYKKETDAMAELEQRKRKAEAERYEYEQKALAIKAKAEAELFAAKQEAEGIAAKGRAEAEAIQAKGEAEAAAMNKKAEAYKKYNGAAMAEMAIKILPEVAANVAKPLGSIDNVNVYGTSGNEVSGLSGNVPVVMAQAMQTIKTATGVDLGDIMKDNSKVISASINS